MSDKTPIAETPPPTIPRFARLSLMVIIVIQLLLGVAGLLTSIQNLSERWLQFELTTVFLFNGIGLIRKSPFWFRVARWASYTVAILAILSCAIVAFIDTSFLNNALAWNASRIIIAAAIGVALLFWWMARRVGRLQPLVHESDVTNNDLNRSILFGTLAICILTGGSPVSFSSTSQTGVGIPGMVTGTIETKRVLWEQGFRAPGLVVFRYPTQTRYGLFKEFEVTVTDHGHSSKYHYTRTNMKHTEPSIDEVLLTGDYIVCDIAMEIEPSWAILGKSATARTSATIKGVGRFAEFSTSSSDTIELRAWGIVSRAGLEQRIVNSVEQPVMRLVLRNGTVPPPSARKKAKPEN